MSSQLVQVKTRVTPDLYSRWKAKLAELRLADGEAMRMAIVQFIGDGRSPGPYVAIVEQSEQPNRRVEVRLTTSELDVLSRAAQAFGASRPRYLTSLVRGHLLREPQFGMAELASVGESNKQLAAFGRHFNQIAKKLNSGENVEARAIAQSLNRVRDEIEEHLTLVHRIMRSNLDRWSIAEASNDDD